MVFYHNNTPPAAQARQQTNASFLSSLMTDVRAKSASLFRFLYDVEEEDHDVLLADDDNFDDGTAHHNYVLFDDLWEMEDIASLVVDRVPMLARIPPLPSDKTQEEEDKVSSKESAGEHMVDKVPRARTQR
ncbi:hypothetical protein MHU86_13498 [Fragilaria crotonensis]|nr:hypothetical protein MHU86_13498 [Fragilaria crotonensis]